MYPQEESHGGAAFPSFHKLSSASQELLGFDMWSSEGPGEKHPPGLGLVGEEPQCDRQTIISFVVLLPRVQFRSERIPGNLIRTLHRTF